MAHYLPDFNDAQRDEATPEGLIEAEHETRQRQHSALQPHLDDAEPLIVAGDFNSPSPVTGPSCQFTPLHMAVEWP